MSSFNMPIIVGKKTLTFEFEEVFVYEGAKFCVTVLDKQRTVTDFAVSKTKSDKWEVGLPAEEWVVAMQPTIAEALSKNYVSTGSADYIDAYTH